ncbi:MAG: hypothetical protein U5O15_00705 [Candidatus Krumholzibacteriota bacterium]|nr:hypothetical protein [Candidatus Krumholzibacteriota bacterium]
MSHEPIKEVLKRHTEKLISIPGVVGTGEGRKDGSPCITIFVTRLTPELQDKIPQQLDGFPVSIKESGMFRSFSQ